MNIIATIEARMASTRLPNKVLKDAVGTPMLGHLVKRLRGVESLNDIVVATTTNEKDNEIAEYSDQIGVKYFRGSEDDVLDRVIKAAEFVNADIIVEITADCPIIDPNIIDQCIQMFLANNVDYLSNVIVRSYPDGMDVQVFALKTLKKSASMTNVALDREHVSLHIRNNPQLFSHLNLVAPSEQHWPELGLTLDEKDDYILLRKIIEHFELENPMFSCLDVIKFLRGNPELLAINETVLRKGNT